VIGRRRFIELLGGAVAVRPLTAQAQQGGRPKRIAMLHTLAATDADARPRVVALEQTLEKLGWRAGKNLLVDYHWAAGRPERIRTIAEELVNAPPDLIVAVTTAATVELLRQTRALPIVFVQVPDPVGLKIVDSLSRPGGNVTGFTNFEFSMGSKWLQIIKEMAPSIGRISLLYNPETDPQSTYYAEAVEAGGPPLAIEVRRSPVRAAAEIQLVLSTLAGRRDNAALILPNTFTSVHRRYILEQAKLHAVPAIYPFKYFAIDGGLVSYGIDTPDLFRRAAAYVDRILRGARPSDLPVQQPTKYEFVINLTTARALGLDVPPTLLALADEVIE
jgi:putative ABC transport system substrate-binding protein